MRRLADDLKSSAQNGRLPCPVAFRLAKESKVPLRTVGDLANGLKVRIINCQLGCFYVEKATHEDLAGVPFDPPLKQEVQDSLVDGKLPCKAAFQVAEKLRVSRKLVGDAATKLKIKIAECQLGCFP
jgi:hypothetical protein